MTGTADTEAFEFQQIYHLETMVIPTHMPMVRKRRERPRVPHLRGKGRRDRRRHQGLLRARPAGAGRHHVDRELRAALELPREGEAAARGAEREAARARGRDRRAGRARRRRSRSPPTWRAAAPTSCWAAASSRGSSSCATTSRCPDADKEREIAKLRAEWQVRHDAGRQARAACTSSAPSATSRGASTTSCAAARAARATRDRRASTCRSRIRCCASSAASGSASIMQKLKMPEGEPIEHPIVNRSIAKAQNARRGAQLRHPQAAARIRRRRQRPAPRHLPAAQRAPRRRPTSPRRSAT